MRRAQRIGGWRGGVLVAVLLLVGAVAVGVAPPSAVAGTGSQRAPAQAGSSVTLPDDLPQVSLGNRHACGVTVDHAVTCWGSSAYGAATPPMGAFAMVAAGVDMTCGLRLDGSVTCWGNLPTGLPADPAGSFTQIDVGNGHLCGVQVDGTVACFGLDGAGQSSPPPGTFAEVSAGGRHTCGLRTDGTVACWGWDAVGQASPPTGTFRDVDAGTNWGAGGVDHTCAVRTDGTLACWGADGSGQASPPSGSFLQVSAGAFHSCGVRDDASVACWGAADLGVTSPPQGAFARVEVGVHAACAVRADGVVSCWGTDGQTWPLSPPAADLARSSVAEHACAVRASGALTCWGPGATGATTAPPGAFRDVAVGDSHSCALHVDGHVACWGVVLGEPFSAVLAPSVCDPGGAGPGPFTDVDAAHPFCIDIEWLSGVGAVAGFPDGSFRPSQAMHRGPLALVLWRLLGSPTPSPGEPRFADVDPSHPSYAAVQWMGEAGLATGSANPAGGLPLFLPGEPSSRQALVTFLWRQAGQPTPASSVPRFADVGPDHPFFAAIQWSGEASVATGSPDPNGGAPTFGPGRAASRQAAAAFLHRAAGA